MLKNLGCIEWLWYADVGPSAYQSPSIQPEFSGYILTCSVVIMIIVVYSGTSLIRTPPFTDWLDKWGSTVHVHTIKCAIMRFYLHVYIHLWIVLLVNIFFSGYTVLRNKEWLKIISCLFTCTCLKQNYFTIRPNILVVVSKTWLNNLFSGSSLSHHTTGFNINPHHSNFLATNQQVLHWTTLPLSVSNYLDWLKPRTSLT